MALHWRARFFGPGSRLPRFSIDRSDKSALPLWIIAGVALIALAVYARSVLIPLVAAVVLYYLFAPVKRRLARYGIGPAASACAIVASLVLFLAAGFGILAAPIAGWVDEAPTIIARVQEKVQAVMEPVAKMRRATDQVEKAAQRDDGGRSMEVVIKQEGLMNRVFGGVTEFVLSLGAILLLLFYLLVRPAPPERAFIGLYPNFGTRRRAFRAIREAEKDLGRYLGTVTVINLSLGAMLAVAFYFLGLTGGPILGAVFFLLNFIPFLGAIVAAGLTLIVGFASFDTLWEGAIPAGMVILAHFVEANFITPAVLGRRLTLDPFLVVLSLLLGAWLWGIAGALLAVPSLLFTAAAWRAYQNFKQASQPPAMTAAPVPEPEPGPAAVEPMAESLPPGLAPASLGAGAVSGSASIAAAAAADPANKSAAIAVAEMAAAVADVAASVAETAAAAVEQAPDAAEPIPAEKI